MFNIDVLSYSCTKSKYVLASQKFVLKSAEVIFDVIKHKNTLPGNEELLKLKRSTRKVDKIECKEIKINIHTINNRYWQSIKTRLKHSVLFLGWHIVVYIFYMCLRILILQYELEVSSRKSIYFKHKEWNSLCRHCCSFSILHTVGLRKCCRRRSAKTTYRLFSVLILFAAIFYFSR